MAGPETNVLFSLPRRQMVGMRARNRSGSDLGLVLLESHPDICSAIGSYVIDELLAE